ncbi:hypothetical protein Tco_1310044 [Tanacetum coccineum]
MTTTTAQQVALDNGLVPLEKRVKIGKCNMRIYPAKTQKNPHIKLFWILLLSLLAIMLSLSRQTFQRFICISFGSPSTRKTLLLTDFDELPSEEEIISFIQELGHTGKIKNIIAVVIDNRDAKKQEKMYYPIFTKAIIHHFLSKDKYLSMRNRMFMHTAQDDCILGTMRFVSKDEDTQVYGALIPTVMNTPKIQDSPSYQTYLAFATGAATPKTKRIYKKPASPSKKRTLVTVEEEVPKPLKKVVPSKKPSRKQSTGVKIQDTPGMYVLKKKAPATIVKSKGINLLSEAALLEEAQLKKVLKKSKQEITIHQAGGSGDGTGSKPGVPDEPKGKSVDIHEGTRDSGNEANEQSDDDYEQADDKRTESDNPRTSDEEEETHDDEYVHTPEDYVPTDDETNDETNDVDEEEYDRIDRELYGDVNVRLTDVEPDDEDKGDKEITNAEIVNAEHGEVSQEVYSGIL